jgi:prophage regulatory protein
MTDADFVFWRLQDVMKNTGLPKSTIYALLQEGDFPTQYCLGGRAVAWRSTDIMDWMKSRKKVKASK